MSAAIDDQAAGLRRLVRPTQTRCWGLLGASGAGLTLVGSAIAEAWRQRGHSVLLLDGRKPARLAQPGIPAPTTQGSDWATHLPPADIVIGLLQPEQRPGPCLAFDEFIVLASPAPQHLTSAYRQLKALSALVGRADCQILVNLCSDDRAANLMDNLRHTARQFLGCAPAALGAIPTDPTVASVHTGAEGGPGADLLRRFPRAPAARRLRELVERLDQAAARGSHWADWLKRLNHAAVTPGASQ